MKNTLFMVGETGGNDYNFALLDGKTIEEAKSMVPEVVGVIIDAVRVSFLNSCTRLNIIVFSYWIEFSIVCFIFFVFAESHQSWRCSGGCSRKFSDRLCTHISYSISNYQCNSL